MDIQSRVCEELFCGSETLYSHKSSEHKAQTISGYDFEDDSNVPILFNRHRKLLKNQFLRSEVTQKSLIYSGSAVTLQEANSLVDFFSSRFPIGDEASISIHSIAQDLP